jgi:hypothetical protein
LKMTASHEPPGGQEQGLELFSVFPPFYISGTVFQPQFPIGSK